MSNDLTSQADLRVHYLPASDGALGKQLDHIDPHCASLIALSPLVCIGTAAKEGLPDVSPRGGEPGFVKVADPKTLLIPDWPGNNRLDSLSNIVETGGIGLLFFIPGVNDMLRVNGVAHLSVAPELREQFVFRGKNPRSVMRIDVQEAYLHCTKALVRAALWNADKHIDRKSLPSTGEMYRDQMKLDGVPPAAIDDALQKNEKSDLY